MTDGPVMPLHMRRAEFDPVDELADVRQNEGVRPVVTALGLPAYLVTRYDDVREVLSDSTWFSNAGRRFFGLPDGCQVSDEELVRMRAGQLPAFDPPEHTRLRRLLTPEFTVRRMRRLEPRIVEIVDAHLNELERGGPPADLVTAFALPIPSLVICELLGVPYADRGEFQHRTRRQLDLSIPLQERLSLGREARDYMGGLVARAQTTPGEDMLSMLVREHGEELSTAELVGIANLLLVAGHETTTNMLGLGTLALLRHPEQLAMVRDDPALVEPAVEELLRWLSIVHAGIPRITTTEVELAGHTIPADQYVVCSLLGANWDPALVDDADRPDITRAPVGQVAFGHRVHHLPGSSAGAHGDVRASPSALPRLVAVVLLSRTD